MLLKMYLMISFFNSLFLFYSLNPILMGATLLNQTIMICLISRMMMNSSWIPSTIFLVMVGGLMIIFIYMTSISSNKKLTLLKLNKFYKITPLMIFLLFMFNNKSIKFKESFQLMDEFNLEFTNLFLPMNIITSNFMFIYLLVMLIIMTEILSSTKGPMRKKY
uniref:NADH dehydrogenase subunit 6 n=1 Tax=Heteropsylla cubana TaxID=121849 RepID=A0A344A2E1_9HEMI|nr:NADH dehydrogenase subunit 6 [Heteropsylla sp. DMP-2018]AWU48932.1 NADH dehydrogenase subunit 6 [Heteropsylla sp. DMP-2018]